MVGAGSGEGGEVGLGGGVAGGWVGCGGRKFSFQQSCGLGVGANAEGLVGGEGGGRDLLGGGEIADLVEMNLGGCWVGFGEGAEGCGD